MMKIKSALIVTVLIYFGYIFYYLPTNSSQDLNKVTQRALKVMDESESSDVDVVTVTTSPQKGRAKRRPRRNLALNQSKSKKLKRPAVLKHDVVIVKSKRQTPIVDEEAIVEGNTFNDSQETVAYSDHAANDDVEDNVMDLDDTQTTLFAPQHDASFYYQAFGSPTVNTEELYAPNPNAMMSGNDTYVERCIQQLRADDTIATVLQKFDDEQLLRHFMAFLRGIADGTLPTNNIAVLTCLERALLQSIENTTQMRYRSDTSLFWEAVLAIGGPRALRLFSSDKHFAQVVEDKTEKSKYNPQTGSFNFAVPDERMLRKSKTQVSAIIQCGFIEDCLQFFDPEKEYVLSLDGKVCGQGLRKHGEGDINLWGYEGPPSLLETQQQLQDDLNMLSGLEESTRNNPNILGSEVQDLKLAVRIVTLRIKSLREAKVRHEILRNSFNRKITRNPGLRSNYELAFAEIKTFLARADDCIQELLAINLEWCRLMSVVNETDHCFHSSGPINIDTQDNGWLLRDPEQIANDNFLNTNPSSVKQRSDLWFKLREQSVITGSTMHNAIGLRTLKDQQSHYDTFVKKKPRSEPTLDIMKAMQHGTNHEVHAIGTILAVLMPAFLPRCHRFKEVGCYFIRAQNNATFMEVSPDGLIECVENCQMCDNTLRVPVGPVAVEIKSPYTPINNKMLLPVHYTPPYYYACQILAEHQATLRHLVWYVSSSKESTTLTFVDYDRDTWAQVFTLAEELYSEEDASRPTRLHGDSIDFRSMLKNYIERNSTLAAEVPTLSSYDFDMYAGLQLGDLQQYRFRNSYPPSGQIDIGELKTAIVQNCERTYAALNEAYELQRRKATEILLFVATDTDREFCKDKPSAIPVAYALKGKSIRIETARRMMADVRRRLDTANVKVLLEAYDGQWSSLVFRSRTNRPLTLLEFDKDCWSAYSRMSKDNLMSFICNLTAINESDMDLWLNMDRVDHAKLTFGNLNVNICHVNNKRKLEVSSNCAEFNVKYGIAHMFTPSKASRRDLWQVELPQTYNLTKIFNIDKDSTERHTTDTEQQLLEDGDDIMQDFALDFFSEYEEEMSDYLPDLDSPPPVASQADSSDAGRIKKFLLDSKVDFLDTILISFLCTNRNSKWQHYMKEQFYNDVLSSANNMYAQLNANEMNIIAREIQRLQHKNYPLIYKSSENKVSKANQLGYLFGHSDHVEPPPLKVHLRSLRHLAITKLRRYVPTKVLRVACAHWKFQTHLQTWLDSSPVPITYQIPVPPYEFDAFSFCEEWENGDMHLKLIDPSHILTNLRLHSLQRGFFGCQPTAFVHVSKVDNKILNRGLVELPILDKQSVPFAQRLFSPEVQNTLMALHYFREANLVKHVRRWYDACNERGLTVTTRIKYLLDMNNYMMQHYNPGTYPMSLTHVQGLPITTFQAIMTNISCRIEMYHVSVKRTYNHRTGSTLPVESLFAALNSLAKNTYGCPLALQIPRYIAKMTQFNTMLNDPTRPFAMRLTKGTNYPPSTMEIFPEEVMTDEHGDCIYRMHPFDKPDAIVRKKKWRRDTISFGNAPLRGVMPLRQLYYKVNESKIKSTRRMGME